MNEYKGGTKVVKGVYLNKANGELTQLYGQVRVLPGGSDERYIKVPGLLAVMGGPFVGLAFVIFLPLVGIIGMIGFLVYKAWHGLVALGRKVFQPVAVGQEPGMAYLTQRRGTAGKGAQNGKGTEEGHADAGIEQIADEVAKRREQGEK
jgi:hypothetical protein